MNREGDPDRGHALFVDEQCAACARCHSVDGSSSKAGPDLFAIGDKLPRRDLIRAVLEPSAEITIGFGTSVVETKAGVEFQGVIKESAAEALELMGADGRRVRIASPDIR